MDRYGLGKERTLEEYYQYAGIDLQKKQVLKNMCDNNKMSLEKKLSASTPEEQPEPEPHEPKQKKTKTRKRSQTIFYVCSFLVLIVVIVVVGYTMWLDNQFLLHRFYPFATPKLHHPPKTFHNTPIKLPKNSLVRNV